MCLWTHRASLHLSVLQTEQKGAGMDLDHNLSTSEVVDDHGSWESLDLHFMIKAQAELQKHLQQKMLIQLQNRIEKHLSA